MAGGCGCPGLDHRASSRPARRRPPRRLLPQNLLWDFHNDGRISVIDWECARIGDPAYDLAVMTRGARKPLKETGGLPLLLDFYNAAAGTSLAAHDVRVHELLLHLRGLAESGRDEAAVPAPGCGRELWPPRAAEACAPRPERASLTPASGGAGRFHRVAGAEFGLGPADRR